MIKVGIIDIPAQKDVLLVDILRHVFTTKFWSLKAPFFATQMLSDLGT